MRVVVSTSARARLATARAFVRDLTPSTELLIVGATRGAADEFARELSRGRATFGVHRFSLTGLAARAAALAMAGAGRLPGTGANAEAMAARATFDACAEGGLHYFQPVADLPGFPRALTRTIHELRLAAASPAALPHDQLAASDLAQLLARVEAQLDSAAVDDRAALFAAATGAWRGEVRWAGWPVVLIDVPLDSAAERDFAAAVCRSASAAIATMPEGDERARRALTDIGAAFESAEDDAPVASDLGPLRRHIFALDSPERPRAGDVRLFSAPGEGREAIEIARRALDEAGRGVPFDDMAVCLRSPQQYLGLLEHAFARAGVPAYFDRGTRRPDPAGRAFVALLSCACEQLSARRFDEYLSLAQVPRIDDARPSTSSGRAPASEPAIPDDEAYARYDVEPRTEEPDEIAGEPPPDSDEDAIVAGTLRAPWKWEELIVESAVIGGVDRAEGSRRWRRRLDGLAADYRMRLDELRRDEPESARVGAIDRDLRNLQHLRAFALPIVDTLAAWPGRASWGEWLDRFTALAPRVLRRPDRVLRLLADLRPMAAVGPVPLDEARDVLQERLLTLDEDPPARRYGRVFVGTPHQTRGRAFRVVFVPGLAERVFPQRVREDPLLPDEMRRETSDALVTRPDRTAAERLLLRLAIGAATERAYLSYPRLGAEMGDMRPRVPSFYALDVMRAITGRVPDHRTLADDAAAEAGASLAWPAPQAPDAAIDDLEHDLAVLKPLLETRDAKTVKGEAHYLLDLNPALRRSVVSRWARWKRRWSPNDGLIRVTPAIAPAIDRNRLRNRPYSLSALQRFASCPYQFLLAAIHRLEVWQQPEPLMRMDPLTRGSLFHRAQAEFFRAIQTDGGLPVTPSNLSKAVRALHEVVDRVAGEYAEMLAPAIPRVWRDEVDEIRRDLDIWVQRLPDERDWVPEYFEFSFGLSDEGRDPRSLPDPITIDGRFVLRGSVDLIERRRDGTMLRVTDHKTGKNRSKPGLVIDGGRVLQPVLYSIAIEQGLGIRVAEGRLYFCTTAGGFVACPIDLNDANRHAGLEALRIIDRAIELGRLPAAPAKDACDWCDFRPVCGPDEPARVARKPRDLVADLDFLREAR